MKVFLKTGGAISYSISIICIGLGFDKILNYVGPDIGERYSGVNAYVGGDAYNYIINSNYATGFFTLAVFFALLGTTLIIVSYLPKQEHDTTSTS